LAIELIAILLVTHIVYNGVISVDIYIVITILLIFFNIYFGEKVKQRGLLVTLIVLQVTFLFTIPIIFWMFKPQYTFLQAKNEVTQNAEFLDGFKVQDKRNVNIKMYNSPNFFVRYAYFIEISDDKGVGDYIVFDSISGEYKFFIK
jgi:predicted tellurium resistance membrane protein TerC